MTIDRSGADDILVSPRGIRDLLRTGVESVARDAPASGEAEEDAEVRAAMRAGLEAALAEVEDAEADGDREEVMFAPDHGPTSLLQAFLAEKAEENRSDLERNGKLVPVATGGYEVKFDEHDLGGWAGSFFQWWRRVFDKHGFIKPPDAPDVRLRTGARIAILGDWGSGRYGAPVCAASIERADPGFDFLVHLGDVYYAGTAKEVRDRFLAFWPEAPGAVSRACNSNHEMYSGGQGLFELTLPKFRQRSTCFAVENDHFLLVGLDTGYNEHDLGHGQVAWLTRLVGGAVANGQKVVLFSHHQPFSLHEKQGPKLVAKLRPLLQEKRIFAWYWGHEHRAVVHDKHPGWHMHGRLVGHGGFPYFRDKIPGAKPDETRWFKMRRSGVPDGWMLDGPNPYVSGKEEKFGANGYMTIELHDGWIGETVRASDGSVLREQEIR